MLKDVGEMTTINVRTLKNQQRSKTSESSLSFFSGSAASVVILV